MKKVLSLALSAILLASALISCGTGDIDRLDPAITLASSDAQANAQWLDNRLETIPNEVVLGIGSDTAYGIDMTEFESDGYIIRELHGEVLLFGKTADGLDRAVRKYAKAAEAGNLNGIDEVYHEGNRIKKLEIAGRDISEYTIYHSAQAGENMYNAAVELQRLIKIACGAELAIVNGEPTGAAIVLRHSDDEALKNDGYKYTVTDSGVVLEGAVKRGCLNAVWRFLEKELDWTNLIYGDSYLTPADYVNVEAGIEETETPAFEFFNMYRHYWGSYQDQKGFGNSAGIMGCTMHGMYQFVEGLNAADPQICYSDEEMYLHVEENVRAYIQNQLDAGQKIGESFLGVDLGQTDSNQYCMCKDCTVTYRKEGTHSGAVVLFVNRIAEAMSVEYSGLYYKIFAYAGTNVPPKYADPNEWLHVTFCTDFNCSNHKVDGSECGDNFVTAPSGAYPPRSNNADYDEWLRGWCEKTDSVYVWFYALDQAFDQYTTLYNMYDDFRHFNELGVDGMFFQCQFDGLGIQRVQHQMLAQLRWDMEMTKEEWDAKLCALLEKEFGDGWESIGEYIEMWERSQDLMGCWHCWGGAIYMDRFNVDYVEANFDTFIELFEDAVKNANCAAQEARAEWLSCTMYYKGCFSSYYRAEARGDTERMQELSDIYDYMMTVLNKHGFDPVEAGIYTVDGHRANYAGTIQESAETDWVSYKSMLTYGIS